MKLRAPLAALAVTALSLGCQGGAGGVGGVLVVANVEVTPNLVEVVLGQTQQLTATPKTASGIVVTGRAVSWSTTDGTVATVSGDGVVTGMAVGGPVRIRATVGGVAGDALITVRPVPVDHVTIEPPNTNLLVAGTTQLTAKAFDVNNALLSGRSFLWESSDHSIATVTTTGVAIGLKEGGPVTISASSEGKTGTASVSVSTRPATRLAFTQQPGLTIAGQAMTPAVRVALQDDLLTTVIGAPNPVTIALAGNPGGATLTGPTTLTPANGIVTFSNLSLNRVGTSYTFLVTAPGLAAATSTPFDVLAGPANQAVFTTSPSGSAQSGATLAQQPVVQLKDGSGNNVAQANVVITASIASGPANATLGGTTAASNSFGIAAFSNLALSGAAGIYTLSFGAAGVTPLVSGPITLSAGSAAALVIATPPSSAAASGVALAQQPAIQLRDAAGNNAPQSGVAVTASIASGGGAVSGTTTATTTGTGLATFTSLAISGPAGGYTLRFSAPGLAAVTSGSIMLGSGGPAQVAIVTQPSTTAASGTAFAQQPSAQLKDASSNNVALAGVDITATVSAGGTLVGTVTQATNASGVATFTNLGISGPVGSYTLTFGSSGLTSSPPSNAITLTAGAATQLSYSQQPSIAAQSGVAFVQQPILQLRDAAGNPVLQGGVGVTAGITGSPAGVTRIGTVTGTTNTSGVASFVGSGLGLSGPAGSYTLTFTAGALSSPASNNITLSAGGGSQLTYNQQPSATASSGQAFAQQPILLLRDASNNPIANVVITATVTGSPASVALIGSTTATTNASGVATFVGSGLGLSGPVGSYTLTFTAGALSSGASNAIVLSAGTPAQLSYSTQPPASASSGVAFGTAPVLLLRDASNNPVAGVVVTATLTGSPAGVSFIGSTTATTNASGLASFTGLGLSGTAGNYTLTFTAGALSSGTSNTIALSAGSGAQLTYTQQPSTTASSGQAFATQPILRLRDASNNAVPNVVVTATITGSPAGVTLIGTSTATTNGGGNAGFSGLGLSGPAGNYTLTFTTTTATSAASNPIALSAGNPTQLTYSTQPPASASSGQAFATAPVLLLRDAASNPVNNVVVTATITGAPAGVSFVGTATATTNASGLATFTGLGLSGPAGGYTLTFTAGAVTSPASNSIALAAGGGTQLTYNQQPSTTANSGQVFTTQPILLLLDAFSTPVSGALVTATVTGSPPGTMLVSATATTDGTGIAAFSGLGLSGPVGSYTLTFTSGTATSAASNTIALSAGTPTQLTYSTQPPASASSGQAFATAPVLLLRDAANNPVNNGVVTATITGSPAGVSFVGTTAATTISSGLASFSDLGLSGPAGTYSLTFTAGAVTSPASDNITLSAGGGTQLTYNQQPSTTANSGVAFAQQPILLLRDASNNPVPAVLVTATITGSPAGAALFGTTGVTTDGSGIASFLGSGLGLSALAGTSYTLTFTTSSATSVASSSITVSTGPATQLTYNTQPSSAASSDQAFGTQPVLLLRDSGNNPVGGQVITATITGSPAGASLVGTATATTDAITGIATFTDLGIRGPVSSYTLTFTAGALSSGASNSIALSAGAATKLGITVEPPANTGSTTPFPVAVQLLDSAGNPVANSGRSIAASLNVLSGLGGLLGGATPISTDGAGTASFTLNITTLGGTFTISFSATGLSSITSRVITIP